MTKAKKMRELSTIVFAETKIVGDYVAQAMDRFASAKMIRCLNGDELKVALRDNPEAILYLEWKPPQTVAVLNLAKDQQVYDRRPIILWAENVESNFLSIVSEYHISVIRQGALTAADTWKDIQMLCNPESSVNLAFQALGRYSDEIGRENFDKALDLCLELTDRKPENLRYKGELAATYIHLNKWHEADKTLNEILMVDRNLPRVLHLKSRVAAHHGKEKEAEEFLKRAVELNPYSAERLTDLGNLQLKQLRAGEARESFAKAMALSKKNKIAAKGLVSASLILGDEAALVNSLKSLTTDEDRAAAFNNAGVFAVQHGKFDIADRLYAKAENIIKDKKTLAKVVYNRTLAAYKSGKKAEGAAFLKKVLTLDPQNKKGLELAQKLKSPATKSA